MSPATDSRYCSRDAINCRGLDWFPAVPAGDDGSSTESPVTSPGFTRRRSRSLRYPPSETVRSQVPLQVVTGTGHRHRRVRSTYCSDQTDIYRPADIRQYLTAGSSLVLGLPPGFTVSRTVSIIEGQRNLVEDDCFPRLRGRHAVPDDGALQRRDTAQKTYPSSGAVGCMIPLPPTRTRGIDR